MVKNAQEQTASVLASCCVRIGPKDCSLQLHNYNPKIRYSLERLLFYIRCDHVLTERTDGLTEQARHWVWYRWLIMSKWKIKNCRDELVPQLNMQNPRFRIRIEHLISGMWGCTREYGRHVILARISMKQACSTMQSSVCLPAKAGQLHLKCWGSRW